MNDDFATSAAALNMDFWDTPRGRHVNEVLTMLDKRQLPRPAIEALKEVLKLHHSSEKISNLEDFSASSQAVRLSNLLNSSLNHYMPGGIIDDSKASASDIKNMLTTAGNVLRLINQVQSSLYTSDRMAAMEKALHQTFEAMTELDDIDEAVVLKLKKLFRAKLEAAFAIL